ncbi:uncharacterized protein C2orf72 homolog isoform X2 [Sceloporus undulatus]|uniref:uncharacterized protein C2orf72 homolog isoform X2 n=1 Tax=Sceloporus undulatus TaxID=8520 RepID=UPI001C4AACF9|nr:uncharacterized protein C2orf72 homolog isoform X2 [Sceloporus undulatus]
MGSTKQGPAPKEPPSPPSAPVVCMPGPGEKVAHDFQMLVQKVGGRPEVLLIGETLEGQDIHSMMAAFVQDLFSAPCHPVPPGEALKEPCGVPCTLGGKRCQLIFFLCRASCLKGKQNELQRVLKEVKKVVQRHPCALVGVIMEPTQGEAEAARAQLLRVLRGVFPKGQGAHKKGQKDTAETGTLELEDIEVEAEVYVPGQPRGKLAIMKAACRASEALAQSRGSSCLRRLLKGLVGTACLVGTSSVALWYLCQYGLLPPDWAAPVCAVFP